MTAPQTDAPLAGRMLSIDVYRGLIMLILVSQGFGLTALAAYPSWKWLADQLEHAAWEGCTFWDLIQPAFTFIAGAAVPLAMTRRRAAGEGTAQQFRHVVSRAVKLIVLSNILSNFDAGGWPQFQLINVLCQLALGYVLCFLIIQLRFRMQVVVAVVMLAAYWGLFLLFPGTDGAFSKTGNIGAVIDRAVLGRNYEDYYTTINFIGNAVTILFGCWTGMLLQRPEPPAWKVKMLAGAGVAGIALGFALSAVNPMVKHLWTASFTLASGGWVILGLLACYWLIDVKGFKGRWTFPLMVAGTNCTFLYSFWQVLTGWLNHGIGVFTGRFAFLGPLGLIPQTLATTAAMWGMCYWLYKRKIFFKL